MSGGAQRAVGVFVAASLAAAISLCDIYRIGVFDEKGRRTRLRNGATWAAWRFILLRLSIDSGIGVLAYVLAPGMRFRQDMEQATTPSVSDALYGVLATMSAAVVLRRKPRAKDRAGQPSKGFRDWLLSFRQFADDRIAEKCYVAVSEWKRVTAVPAIMRLPATTVRDHFWNWLDRYSGLDGRTVEETKNAVTAALGDITQPVEHIISTVIETFLALPRSDECIRHLVRIGQQDGQPNAFATSLDRPLAREERGE